MIVRGRFKLRFHHLLTALLGLFVVSLTGLFLLMGYVRLERMAERNAGVIFAQIAARNAIKLEATIASAGSFVKAQAAMDPRFFRNAAGLLDDSAMVSGLLAAVRVSPEVYGYYFGLDTDEFLQVIGVRADAKIAAALDAPAATWFAVRAITLGAGSVRHERWRFLDEAGVELASRDGVADYAPRTRPWYRGASQIPGLQITEPYVFASSGAIGVTLSQALEGGGGVFGADLTLHDLGDFVAAGLEGREGGAVVLDELGRVLVFEFSPGLAGAVPARPLQWPDDIGDPYLAALVSGRPGEHPGTRIAQVGDERFVYAERFVELAPHRMSRVAAFAPMRAFSGPIVQTAHEILLIAAAVLLVSLPLAFFITRRAVTVLGELARDSERIKQFDFSGRPRVHSMLYEIDALGSAHRLMKVSLQRRTRELKDALHKLESLVENGLLLSAERDRQALLGDVLRGAGKLCNAEAAQLYLATPAGTLRPVHDGDAPELALHDAASGAPNERELCVWVALQRRPALVDDVRAPGRFDFAALRERERNAAHPTRSLLAVPLTASSGELIGVLQLTNAREGGGAGDGSGGAVVPFPPAVVQYVEAFAAQAAVALDNHRLLAAQAELMDALIRIIAGAIDAKSAYTGGHCARVPELALMLAEEACRATEGPLADFAFRTEDEWREFRIGAWLHDCGKVTTPEYVVDKATKLETIYNRIHEIRMRFEVLLRDAEIDCLRAVLAGGDAAAAEAACAARRAQLADDFAFVAACNLGAETMGEGQLERLQRIAGERWLRHLDDRLGLSQDELRRRADIAPAPLPASEALLADQPWHVVPRPATQRFDAAAGFRLTVPERLYDFGELHNLSVARGTLSAEERFKINEHVIQTILMLERLPLPPQLRRIPEYAGTHHETLIGTGYPRGLSGAQLSVPARIMAIADVFEALTAADRPYKKAKTLSESVAILARFVAEQHLDADLFALFLRSGVHLRYAERFLAAEQIDDVDIGRYLSEGGQGGGGG